MLSLIRPVNGRSCFPLVPKGFRRQWTMPRLRKDVAFDESKHKRNHGQFSSTGGTVAGNEAEAAAPDKPKVPGKFRAAFAKLGKLGAAAYKKMEAGAAGLVNKVDGWFGGGLSDSQKKWVARTALVLMPTPVTLGGTIAAYGMFRLYNKLRGKPAEAKSVDAMTLTPEMKQRLLTAIQEYIAEMEAEAGSGRQSKAADFDESKHPRADDGKFGSGPGKKKPAGKPAGKKKPATKKPAAKPLAKKPLNPPPAEDAEEARLVEEVEPEEEARLVEEIDPDEAKPVEEVTPEPTSKAEVRLSSELDPKDKAKVTAFVSKYLDGNSRKVADLIGAPDASEVQIVAASPNSISVFMRGKGFEAERTIHVAKNGDLYVQNETIEVEEAARGNGIGTEVFSRQVAQAEKMGAKWIECRAAKIGDRNGYYTWPRLGYDGNVAELAPDLKEKVAKAFPKAKTIQDIFATEQGRAWWKQNGGAFKARFDLSKNSRSRQVLAAYLKAKGK